MVVFFYSEASIPLKLDTTFYGVGGSGGRGGGQKFVLRHGGATPWVLGRQPPPPHGASGQQLVVKGTGLRSRWVPKVPNRPQELEPLP